MGKKTVQGLLSLIQKLKEKRPHPCTILTAGVQDCSSHPLLYLFVQIFYVILRSELATPDFVQLFAG